MNPKKKAPYFYRENCNDALWNNVCILHNFASLVGEDPTDRLRTNPEYARGHMEAVTPGSDSPLFHLMYDFFRSRSDYYSWEHEHKDEIIGLTQHTFTVTVEADSIEAVENLIEDFRVTAFNNDNITDFSVEGY